MPRAGLTPSAVVIAGAELADDIGLSELTLARVAEKVGVRAPSLYKHVTSQADLTRRIAALALVEAGETIGHAIQGRSGHEALNAAAHALRDFINDHPGRYNATLIARPLALRGNGPDDAPLMKDDAEGNRLKDDPVPAAAAAGLQPLRAVLRGYDIPQDDEIHALRALRSIFHGFATLEAADGFQYGTNIDESFNWLVTLIDHGLRSMAAQHPLTTAPRTVVLP